MSWYDDVWAKIWSAIKLPLEAILHAVEAFGLAGAKSIAINGGLLLIDSATAAVQAMAATEGSGADKRNAAIAIVTRDLEAGGVKVVENAVRLAIEKAVAALKADIPELNVTEPKSE